MRLLLIHGRAQERKSSEIIENEWMTALRRGFDTNGFGLPAGLKVDVPFYGDELLKQLERYDVPPADDAATRGELNDEYAAFLEDVAMQLRSDDKVTHREVEDEMGTRPGTRGPENWEWVQAAYEVLREHVGNSVPRLVTVGSPLGIRAIRDQLATPLSMPAGVRDWYNAFDDRDVVALYPLNAGNFNIRPPVKNYPFVNNHTDNRHGIAGYLDDADVAFQIDAALRGQ